MKTGAIDGGEKLPTERVLPFYGLQGTKEEAIPRRLLISFVEEVSKKDTTTQLLIVFTPIGCYSKTICV